MIIFASEVINNGGQEDQNEVWNEGFVPRLGFHLVGRFRLYYFMRMLRGSIGTGGKLFLIDCGIGFALGR